MYSSRFQWDPSLKGHCWDRSINVDIGYLARGRVLFPFKYVNLPTSNTSILSFPRFHLRYLSYLSDFKAPDGTVKEDSHSGFAEPRIHVRSYSS